MKLINKVTAVDGYGFALVANDSQFGVVFGYSDGDLDNHEMDIEPEWFEEESQAAENMNIELSRWNSLC